MSGQPAIGNAWIHERYGGWDRVLATHPDGGGREQVLAACASAPDSGYLGALT